MKSGRVALELVEGSPCGEIPNQMPCAMTVTKGLWQAATRFHPLFLIWLGTPGVID